MVPQRLVDLHFNIEFVLKPSETKERAQVVGVDVPYPPQLRNFVLTEA